MSPVPARKPVAAAPAIVGVKFGRLDAYSAGGFQLPPGRYAMFFDVRRHAYSKADGSKGQEMLGVMATCYPLDGGDPAEHFMSLGKKAILGFAPIVDKPAWNGLGSTGFAPIPGAPAVNLAGMTNFNLFIDSLYQSGLDDGVFEDDISPIDGIWVVTENVPAPESRKSMGAQTGEVAQQQANRGPDMITVVTEILDGGKPWEGGGGLPDGASNAPVAAAKQPATKPGPKVAPAPAAKVAPKPVAKTKPAPAPVVEEAAVEGDPEDAQAAAIAGVGSVLEANPNGVPKMGLKTKTFAYLTANYGDEMAQTVTSTYFKTDADLAGLLEQLGYSIQGTMVKVAS